MSVVFSGVCVGGRCGAGVSINEDITYKVCMLVIGVCEQVCVRMCVR